jgi:hypothetical protein
MGVFLFLVGFELLLSDGYAKITMHAMTAMTTKRAIATSVLRHTKLSALLNCRSLIGLMKELLP